MRTLVLHRAVVAAVYLVSFLAAPPTIAAQTALVVPTRIPISGYIRTADGAPRTGPVVLVISLYDGQGDPAPRWIEHQRVTLDGEGRYDVVFGATRDDGLAVDLFTGDAGVRWLGVAVENEPEQPRVMLVSVPYAAKAASADTLAGKSASEFVLTSTLRDDVRAVLTSDGVTPSPESDVTPQAQSANFVAKFQLDNGPLTDSILYDNGTAVGVGTVSPAGFFHIRSGISGAVPNTSSRQLVLENAGDSGFSVLTPNANTGTLYFGSTSDNRAAKLQFTYNLGLLQFGTDMVGGATAMLYGDGNEGLRLTGDGRVGIGTASPVAALDVRGDAVSIGANAASVGSVRLPNNSSVRFRNASNSGDIQAFEVDSSDRINFGPDWMTLRGGNLGVGTTNPTVKLHVAGAAAVIGDIVVDGNIAAKYQDVAEWVDAAEPLDAGTVVIIDPAVDNRVMAADRSYDRAVAGAVSPQPGLTLGEPGPGKALIAQSGRVRVKVDAKYGPIRRGDLLVSSPTKGHAMRTSADKARPGTVLGKALEPWTSGRGEILVLLTLQ